MGILKLGCVAGALLQLSVLNAAAQVYAPRDSVTVVAGKRYAASGLHKFFFGSHYRSTWTTPIRVPVLHLAEFGGGLKPTQRGGGMQTKSLRLAGPDGREFQFRSVDKDPSPVLPKDLRETIAADILQDQISASHPAGALIVVPLLDAARVLHPNPVLVVMADEPGLGEFRKEFAGLLGVIEERPRDLGDPESTFAGASDIVGTPDLFKKLDNDPTVRVDPRAFVRARLLDVYIGDWDRHADQWRWALVDSAGPKRWLPIPRDRDQAFARYDGFLLSQARRIEPKLVSFDTEYDNLPGATWNGRNLDRRFLAELDKPAWDSIAASLHQGFTDATISAAVHAQPTEYYPVNGARMERALRARRDGIERMADKYYRMLAHQPEVYGSDQADEAVVQRQRNGITTVTLSTGGKEYFRRTFDPDRTQEIRLYLHGGNDNARVEGSGGPRIRIVGGGGDDQYTVSGGGVHLYDDRGTNRATGAGINTKEWNWRKGANTRVSQDTASNALPPRDWGRKTMLWPTVSYGYDIQAVLGYGGRTDWYAFRRAPYSTQASYRLEVATGKPSGRVTLGLSRLFENSGGFYALDAMASGIELNRWYGFGNESPNTESKSFYRVNRTLLTGGARLGVRFGRRNELSFGPVVVWSRTDTTEKHNRVRFIGDDQPYGVGDFGMVGGQVSLKLDGRDYPGFASKGGALFLTASGYPKAWEADEAVGRVEAEGTFALAPQGRWRPSIHFMAGGIKTWGKLPYFLAATLGGSHRLRGYWPDRFAGDAAVYGSGEVRVPLTRIKFVVPGQQGFFAFADGGRVYLEGESSDTWHTTAGGGIWFSFLTRQNVAYVGLGRPTRKAEKSEGTRVIIGFGFPY